MLDSSVQAVGMPQNHAMFVANRVFDNNADLYHGCRARCPRRAVPVGTGHAARGRRREHLREQPRLRQLALRRRPVLDPGEPARRERPGQATRHLPRQPLRRQPDGRHPVRHPGPERHRLLVGRAGRPQLLAEQRLADGFPRSDPATLPTCDRPSAGGPYALQGNPAKTAVVTACAAFRPGKPAPPGCDWLTTPARPGS